jgi:hypothetical protein
VSVNGVEEDGVDNRVEAPTWAPDGGSENAAPEQDYEEIAMPADEAADGVGSAPVATPAREAVATPHASKDAIVTEDEPPANGQAAPGPIATGPQQGPMYAPVAPKAAAPPTAPLPAAMDAAAGAARGLAAKVASPFSALTRPKAPKAPKVQKAPARKPQPGGPGPGPRPGGGARPQARLTAPAGPGYQTRRAQLRLDRIEPWSVMKFSFLISLVGWVILFVAVSVLYFALSKLGVFTSVEHTVGLVTSNKAKPLGSNAASWFKASRVLGYTMLVGAVNVVLITAFATVGSVLYNLVTMLAGGIEVTLKESD